MITRLSRLLGHHCSPPPTAVSGFRCWCGQRWVVAFVPLSGYRWHRIESEVRL